MIVEREIHKEICNTLLLERYAKKELPEKRKIVESQELKKRSYLSQTPISIKYVFAPPVLSRVSVGLLIPKSVVVAPFKQSFAQSPSRDPIAKHFSWEYEEIKNFLENLKDKLKKGEELNNEELKKFIEIDMLADRHPELKKGVREIISLLEKNIPSEIVELNEGEIKEIDKDIIVRKRKDGVVEVIIL